MSMDGWYVSHDANGTSHDTPGTSELGLCRLHFRPGAEIFDQDVSAVNDIPRQSAALVCFQVEHGGGIKE